MERISEASPALKVPIWLGAVAASGVVGLLLVGATYDEFMDCSNPEIHESANTSLAWTVAVLASALPVAVSIWLAGGLWRKLPALALAVALLSLGLWRWLLDAGCEWYAAA